VSGWLNWVGVGWGGFCYGVEVGFRGGAGVAQRCTQVKHLLASNKLCVLHKCLLSNQLNATNPTNETPLQPPSPNHPAPGEKLSESNASDVRQLCSTLLNAYLIQLLETGLLHAGAFCFIETVAWLGWLGLVGLAWS